MKELKSVLEKKEFMKTKLIKLREIIENKSEIIQNSKNYINKIDRFVNSINGPIKIVFLGSFSAGKTTAIAGLLEEEKDDMQINTDESSNTIKSYCVRGFEDRCVFIDTPGLFGNKESDNGDEKIRYEDMTLRYISEANVIVYVVEAENPLKESHRDSLNYVLRTLNKLPNTIFVINKMDSVADLSEEDDFKEQCLIKTENLINKLKLFINLEEEEAKKVNVVCVSLDPGKKSLKKWFANDERKTLYLGKSRIQNLRKKLIEILEVNECKDLMGETIESVVSDICCQIQNEINTSLQETNNNLQCYKKEKNDIERELQLFVNKQTNFENMTNKRMNDVLALIESADSESISQFDKNFFLKLGDSWKESWNNLFGDIYSIEAFYLPQLILEKHDVAESQSFSIFDGIKVVGGLAQKGASLIEEEKIDNKKVLAARNEIRNYTGVNHKFKPHGAKKVANKINQVGHTLEGVSRVADFTCKNKEHIEKVVNTIASLGQRIYAQYELKKQKNELKRDVVKLFDDFKPSTIEIESYKDGLKEKCGQIKQIACEIEKEKMNLEETISQIEKLKDADE